MQVGWVLPKACPNEGVLGISGCLAACKCRACGKKPKNSELITTSYMNVHVIFSAHFF